MKVLAVLRGTEWPRRDRVVLWGGAILVEQVLMFACVILWAFGVFGTSRPPIASDFPSFYGAGTLVWAGTPHLAYDQAAHWQAERAAGGANVPYTYFFYPPPYLLLCAALACLPYMVAYVLFEAVTLVLYVLVTRRIAAIGGWAWAVPALAFPAVYWTLGLGQNALLTASIFGAATFLTDSRPGRAGVLFGLLSYKPHFGLLVPLALAAGGHWRVFFSAAATVAGLIAVTTALFGVDTWRDYLTAFAASGSVYASGKIMLAGYVTAYGAARLIGLAHEAALGVQVMASLVVAVIVVRLWYRGASLPLRAAALLAGTVLSVPLALLYDLLLVGVCVAWLARAARETGLLPWEKAAMLTIYLISLVSLFVGLGLNIPLGPLAPAIVLALCVRRAARESRGGERPAAA